MSTSSGLRGPPDLGGVPPSAEQCKELFKMMPEAFLFTYAGSDKSATKLNYGPNPNLQPPSREARVSVTRRNGGRCDSEKVDTYERTTHRGCEIRRVAHLLVLVFPPITQLWVPRPCVARAGPDAADAFYFEIARRFCRPYGTRFLSWRRPRTYVLGYLTPSIRDWGGMVFPSHPRPRVELQDSTQQEQSRFLRQFLIPLLCSPELSEHLEEQGGTPSGRRESIQG